MRLRVMSKKWRTKVLQDQIKLEYRWISNKVYKKLRMNYFCSISARLVKKNKKLIKMWGVR